MRAWHILFLAVLVSATIALAWWQWTRFRSGSGTFQNLGYALQWPFFGGFFVYAYRKFVEYENQKREAEAETGRATQPADEATAPGAELIGGTTDQGGTKSQGADPGEPSQRQTTSESLQTRTRTSTAPFQATPSQEGIDERFLPQRRRLSVEEFNRLNDPRLRRRRRSQADSPNPAQYPEA